MKNLRTLSLLLVVIIIALSQFGVETVRAAATTHALWVFSDEVSTPANRATLVKRSAASGVNTLYLSVYRSTPNSAGRRMYQDSDMAQLIQLASDSGIRVWAAYGAPDWPKLGCAATAFPMQRMAEVVNYNNANPSAPFAGVILDVEPPEPQSAANFQALLSLYQCVRAYLPSNLGLAVAIRFYWNTPVEFPTGGQVKPAYQHIIDMNLDKVVVMGYRDFAGTTNCGTGDGVICLDKEEIAYADSQQKYGSILIGLETGNCVPGCGPEKVTFFEEGQSELNLQAQAITNHLNGLGSTSFDGFAIHRYKGAYLGDVTGWPIANPAFPSQ